MNIADIEAPFPLHRNHSVEDESVIERAESMATSGQFSPINVYPTADGTGYFHGDGRGRYTSVELLASQGRAVKGLAVGEIRVIVNDYTPKPDELLLMQIEANVQTKSESAKDLGNSILTLSEEYGHKVGEIAARLNVSKSKVSKWCQISKLPEEIQAKVEDGTIGLNVAQVAIKYKDIDDEPSFYEKAETLNSVEFAEWAKGIREDRKPPVEEKEDGFVPRPKLVSIVDAKNYLDEAQAELESNPSELNEGRVIALKLVLGLDPKSVQEQELAYQQKIEAKEAKKRATEVEKAEAEVKEAQAKLEELKGKN